MAYAAYWIFCSQSKPSASTPSVSASTVKPAQHEKGAASSSTAGVAAKPATTTAPAAKTTSSVLSTSTASPAAAISVTNIGATTGPKASGGVTTTTGSPKSTITKESPKVAAQAPPVSPAKAPPVSAGTTGAVGGAGKTPIEVPKPKETPKVQDPKVPSKVTSTVTKPTATTVLSATAKEAKVKSEASAKASTPAPDIDPFDALAGSLPPAEPPKPTQFTGPEVKERDVTADVAQRCGERDDTLPPGYRQKDMEKKTPSVQPEKPKQVSKPITSDEALESLSSGFTSSPPPAASKPEVKHETVAAAATHKSFSPAPPVQKAQAASVPANLSPAPPADKKPRVEKVTVSPDKAKQDPKADPMSLDALDALAETLPEDKPAPEPPKLKPEQIVDEKKQKSEKGVRVGEREDSIPPEYRFKEDKNAKPIPPSPKEPPMGSADALDFLSGDFTDASAAPAVHSAAAPPKAQAKQPKVEDIAALEALESDFVAPAHAKKVCSGAPPVPTPATKSTSDQGDMSLDALDALGDTLPEAKPVPESPKLRPEDMISEPKLKSEKGVRVGERDDTLPPDYRFPKDDPKSQPPPPKKEPSLDTNEALDLLSEGFDSSSTAPQVQSQIPPSAPPATSSSDFALDALSDDFVSVSSASKVCSSTPAPPTTDSQGDMSLDALDALGDTLPEAKPVPESPKLRPEDMISEPKLKSEKGVRVGERDDTLPPDYRFPKDDPKSQPPPPKKEPSLDTNEALDLLSEGFDSSSTAPQVQSQIPPSAPPATSSGDFDLGQLEDDLTPSSASKVCSAASAPTAIDRQMSDGATSAMDALSETLDDIRPAPAPAPVLPKNIVKEKEVKEERVHKAGERDDSLPPEYRPTEADIKAAAKAKAAVAVKKPSIDDSQALDILSSDFDSKVPVTQPAAQCQASAAASVKTSSSQKESGVVLDKLADSLLPENFPATKQSDSKPKGKGRKSKSASKKPAVADAPAAETLPAKPSKDVSSTSVKKGGKS
ncbi:calpastatin isoform 5-T5 [Clarias gariepinus]|uniref:calpastatin isoform X5 n=1 Tax=Clarias gariepinus TaxID=13013 RepID=UPI00234D6907|nr:calpastatin isoform X5 [Clarias gariepinus]